MRVRFIRWAQGRSGLMEPEYVRLFQFMESVRQVWLEHACLTELGAAYMGVPFRFPPPDAYEGQLTPLLRAKRIKDRVIGNLEQSA